MKSQKEIDDYDRSMEPYANNPEYLAAYPRYDQEIPSASITRLSISVCSFAGR